MKRSTRIGLITILLVLCTAWSVYAGGSTEVPEAQVSSSGTRYISPNGDGVKEEASISFAVSIYVKSLEGYIPEYGIRILDSAGSPVREIVEQQASELGWLRRLFRRYQEFTLEKTIPWDGTDSDGNLVDDGVYQVELWIIDDKGERIEPEFPDTFVVDTTPPSVDITLQESMIFSPNDDGNLETFEIKQTDGTVEDSWEAEIVDVDGDVVRTYVWTNNAPESFLWDGTNDEGELTADGAHRYRIATTDRAGNSFSFESGEFQLVTIETPLYVTLSEEYISPNGDGVQDELEIALDQEISDDIVRWSLSIDDGEGTVIRNYGADGAPPERIVFDGLDDSGEVARQDTYRALYQLRYRNGNEPFTHELFVVDVTKPAIDVLVSQHIISPNGDGRQDETSIWFRSSEPVTWEGNISDSRGATILSTDSTRTTSLIVWRGSGPEGDLVADGDYRLNASFTDLAGNTFEIPTEEIVVDVTAPTVTFALDKDYFSPDDDGIKDTLSASFTADEPVRGLLTLTDSAGRDVGTLGGFGRAYQYIEGSFSYTWGGITGSGLYIPDGEYTVSSIYEDRAGNRVSLDEKRFTVDTRRVRVALSAPKGFSPNDDGKNDTITVSVNANFYDTVDSWRLSFVDGYDKVLREVTGDDRIPREFTWDGSMQFGGPEVKTSEGLYRARLEATYRKGNTVDVESGQFFVDVTPPAVNLQATADPFAQSNGTIEGDLYITLQIDDAHEVDDWSMDILTPDNEIVRSFTGTGDLQDQIVWKDDRQSVARVPRTEQMIVRVGVVDEVGNFTTFERSVPLDILVVNRDGKLYLMVPNVIFDAYQHTLDSRGAEQYQKNLESIDRVVEIYNKYPDYRLLLEGHALNVFHGDDNEKEAKEEEVLVPLTERRATTVRDALLERGIATTTVEIEWFGGRRPIVDVHDREIRWKNRRVEFIMLRPEEE